jgi:uncharacterized protein
MNDRLSRLLEYIKAIENNQSNLDTYKHYESDILSVNHEELFILFDALLKEGHKPKEILVYLDKLVHVFSQSLDQKKTLLLEDSFLDHLTQENRELELRLNNIKQILIENKGVFPKDKISLFEELEPFTIHYTKIQNILFPYLEKKADHFSGVSIMWSLHDLTRTRLKETIEAIQLEKPFNEVSKLLGEYFFKAFGLIQKEEMILFQLCSSICSIEELEEMRYQSFEYGFAWIKTPIQKEHKSKTIGSAFFSTDTGELSFEQLSLFLDALPIDCTYVDDHNKVRYFNRPKDRIFPRSPSVIGRDVRNCHPAESVDVVNQIIEAFRKNEQSEANFWIEMRGKFLYIRYFALRDKDGVYKGVLELSQEVSEIRSLQGQRRLLQWDKKVGD